MINKNMSASNDIALVVARCLLLFIVIGFSACTSGLPYKINLMPAPDIYDQGAINPFVDKGFVETIPYSGMLYATDRQPAPEKDSDPYYLNKRGHLLRLGVAQVKLNVEGMTWEEARRISLLKNRTKKYPLQVAKVEEFGVLYDSYSLFDDPKQLDLNSRQPAEHFAEIVNEKLDHSKRKDIYIYIHGYKVNFENPMLVASELWHFLGYDGVFIAYAWPSTPKRLAYFSDLETAQYSARNFRTLLDYLARETKAERIHIVSYSAGTRVAFAAIAQLALLHKDSDKATIQKKLHIGHVIMVGSDLDSDILGGHILDGLLKVPAYLTVYLSETDKALGVSTWVFGRKRVGQIRRELPQNSMVAEFLRNTSDLIVIDVTDAEDAAAGNGHAYFRQSPWASSDILMTLMYYLSPEQRGLVRTEEWPIWSFPPDYIIRLKHALIEVNQDPAKGAQQREAAGQSKTKSD